MPRFKKVKAITYDGWSEWQAPIQGYKMACCDCGLVHDMEFLILKVTKQDGPNFEGDDLPFGEYRVLLRARRNNRSTAAMRRKTKTPPVS